MSSPSPATQRKGSSPSSSHSSKISTPAAITSAASPGASATARMKDKEDVLGSPPGGSGGSGPHHSSHSQDSDLFSFLSAMHLSGGGNVTAAPPVPILTSRKRKFLEQGGALGGGSGKHNLNMRPPYLRRGSEDEHETALHTPQCSQSGYADDEDHHHHHGHYTEAGSGLLCSTTTHSSSGRKGTLLSPSHPQMISEIDENLASNFDDSLSGLGVDIASANYSMSEALLALPNLSISSSHIFKSDHSPPLHRFKEEPHSSSNSRTPQNFGALDLSNDEAHLPDSPEGSEEVVKGPKTFTGSVSRDASRDGTPLTVMKAESIDKSINSFGKFINPSESLGASVVGAGSNSSSGSNISNSNPNLSTAGVVATKQALVNSTAQKTPVQRRNSTSGRSHKIILPAQGGSVTPSGTTPHPAVVASSSTSGVHVTKIERMNNLNGATVGDDVNRFQYILAASTSLATKLSEPSITYLNQGQAYELRLKKLGDLSPYRKKNLKCVMRICFHERRLQYMEAEQINEWKNSHPGERILEIDLPLSFGVNEPEQDSMRSNAVSFKWDPTRETGIFLKVNCISTEFTPKKHGGEKGVPFRLQVETFDTEGDLRLHAAGCILQVFKLKGADRKHKQDRDKISKRPQNEQEKFAPSYDCTVLTELSVENIYVPPLSSSRAPSPTPSTSMGPKESPAPSSVKIDTSPVDFSESQSEILDGPFVVDRTSHLKQSLSLNSTADAVTQWLGRNRYGNYISNFRNYTGRDMMRLMREELINICGLVEGIRLYNDLHMIAVSPRATFYVAQKDSHEYQALFLEELTLREFMHRFAMAFGVEASLFSKAFIIGPHGIYTRLTDAVIQFTKPETVFHFSVRANNDNECDVVFENITPFLDTSEAPDIPDGSPSNVDGSNNSSRVQASRVEQNRASLDNEFDLNSVRIHNRERLVEVLEHRPPHVPVITVANHHSCMDEPLIWGILDFKHLTNPYLMRWALAAHDICFTNKLHAQFFAYGKSIPIVRGEGVYQGGMNFCVERLNEGRWIHLYPEGKVNVTKDIDLRLKWGVGRLISDCQELPIVIPIYHYGMDDILPNSKPYIPRIRQKVTVNVGEPINLEETMRDLKARNADAQERRRVITDVIQEAVRKLKKNTEILHARNTFKPN
eukprot:maker-scaffold1123_size61443-snap-gene-0.27 protein:Tk01080 transcript:maker-scaffold1123_size61443-snap-gene-0.27-mRNA-1 annotation:"hypothetical protein DAPPUDRAFT_306508"